MTDQEIMLSLSKMLEPIKSDISGMKSDISGIKSDISEMKNDISRIDARVKKLELTQENEILPRLQTIESCYTSTYDRYRQSVDGYDALRQDMDIVKKTVAEHSAKLQMIPILRRKKVKM